METKTNKAKIVDRDGNLRSPWQNESRQLNTSGNINTVYDVLVVGAGITGVTAALLLQQQGKICLLVDAHHIGFGTTGGTSAHINTFADTTYKEAASAFGKEGAQLFANAVNEGFAIIKDNVDKYRIDCDYEAKTGYLYAENDEQVKQLDDVYQGTVAVGVSVAYTDHVPTPLSYKKALVFDGQAQFHPIKYINALIAEFVKAGGSVMENTLIDSVEKEDNLLIAKAGEQAYKANKVIYATHMPPGLTSFNFRCAPYRSYIIAVKLKRDKYPDELIYDMEEPYHYLRTHVIDGEPLLLVGGNDHKTGHDDPKAAFEDLEKYIRKNYAVSSVKYKWSSQYYIPADGFPYVGQVPSLPDGVYCATGFNGNGMMLGSVSAKILSDLIVGSESKYEKVFSTSRIKPVAGFTDFIQENADVAYHFVADRFGVKETDSLNRLQPGNGEVVEVNGKKVAAYKDMDGNLHVLNPVCTHAKCIVNFNSEEISWDCPCHGARFDVDGRVITGPARLDLEKVDYEFKSL